MLISVKGDGVASVGRDTAFGDPSKDGDGLGPVFGSGGGEGSEGKEGEKEIPYPFYNFTHSLGHGPVITSPPPPPFPNLFNT
jgi:hypothetical protein